MSRTMESFYDRNEQLYCEELPVVKIAVRCSTPFFI